MMKEVIDAMINMLHRKGIVTDEEIREYQEASIQDFGNPNPPRNVINAINQMGSEE
jgi:hypothetical protein